MSSAFVIGILVLCLSPVHAQTVVRIGELNSYQRFPLFLEPYRRGLELGVEQYNRAAGGRGYRLELIVRDDGGEPDSALRAAQQLVERERVAFLMGTFRSHVALAVSEYAKRNRVLFFAIEPHEGRVVREEGQRYLFRLLPSTYTQAAMLVPHAVRQSRKRWALVYPDCEYGLSAARSFRALLKRAQPDVEIVAEQRAKLNWLEAGPIVQALAEAKPDAIFSALFGAGLQEFVREGDAGDLFEGRVVVNLLGGEPEYLERLEAKAVDGWYVTGYPTEAVRTPEHFAFRTAYEARFREPPKAGALTGYVAIQVVAALLAQARSVEKEKLVEAFEGLRVRTAVGMVRFREGDHQSTMGAYVGRIGIRQGRARMVDWYYADGALYLPPSDPSKGLIGAIRKSSPSP